MKKLANLKGVKTLNKKEQKSVNGGASGRCCDPANACCMPNDGSPTPGCIKWGNSNCQFLYSSNCCF